MKNELDIPNQTRISLAGYICPSRLMPAEVYPVFLTVPDNQLIAQIYSSFTTGVELRSAELTDLALQPFPDDLGFLGTIQDLRSEPIICIRISKNRFELGKISEIRHTLRRLLNQDFFTSNPFLGLEVAKAADASTREQHFAKLCLKKIVTYTPSLARDWLRDALLEPEIKNNVLKYLVKLERTHGKTRRSKETEDTREAAWQRLEAALQNEHSVDGMIFRQVKGGYTVDLDGAVGFLPGSQVDTRPIRDVKPLMKSMQKFKILKLDRRRGNIVVSRRAVLEDFQGAHHQSAFQRLREGQVLEGIVENIVEYGAFVDLDGFSGLLHISDMSWTRIDHPSEVAEIGDKIKVKVIEINRETQRVSLGIKQLQDDPWIDVELKYPPESIQRGRVTHIVDYGAFVELEPGVDGLVHISEMTWGNSKRHPSTIVSKLQDVEVKVLDLDASRRRMSLSLKRSQGDMESLYEEVLEGVDRGQTVTVEVTAIDAGGIEVNFMGLTSFIRRSDISIDRKKQDPEMFDVGDRVDVRVTKIDRPNLFFGVSIKAQEKAEEEAELNALQIESANASAKTNLGDILREAFLENSADSDEKG